MKIFDRLVVSAIPMVPKPLVRRVASRYVAGETLDDAMRTVRALAAEGAMSTLDVLGESVTRPAQTYETRDAYMTAIDAIQKNALPCNISIKPTAVGLAIDRELALENCRAICRKAAESQMFVRLDMEDTPYTDATIELALQLKSEYPHLGTVLQAYLRRSLGDVTRLAAAGMNLRICKGIYVEPRRLAYKDRQVVIESFGAIVDKHLSAGCYAGIATHDEACVQRALVTIDRLGLRPDQYEFQMLLGVDPLLRQLLIASGHRLRVYVPFGRDWYAYSTRRLKENPSLVSHIVKAALGLAARD